MGWPSWLHGILELVVLGILGYAAYLDVKFREVEPAYWYASIRILAPLGASLALAAALQGLVPRGLVVAQLAADAVAVGVAAAVYLAGLLGGGDLFATALIAAATPLERGAVLPPALLALLYGSVLASLHTIYYCLVNISRHRSRLSSLRRAHGALRALQACFTAKPMRVSDALASGWLYPASWELGSYKLVEEDPPVLLAQLAEDRGFDSYIWVTPGLPQVLYITLGYLASLLVGDQPIRLLLMHLA